MTNGDGQERVLLVDLCGTLYNSNTTFDFLRSFLAGDARYEAFSRRWNSLPARVVNRMLPGDIRRERAIACLSGRRRDDLGIAAAAFFDRMREITEVVELVRELRGTHDRSFLLSSSLDFIVEQAALRLGFDGWFATELEYDEQICTGRMITDLLDNKPQVIEREFGGTACTLISDNRGDLNCQAAVERFIGVAPAKSRSGVSWWSNRVSEVVIHRT